MKLNFRLTKQRHDSWLRAIGRNPEQEHLSTSNVICSEHFADSDFLNKEKTKLCSAAVPSVRLRKSSQVDIG